jgi:hypothetical protein
MGFHPTRAASFAMLPWLGVPALLLAGYAVAFARYQGHLATWLRPRWGDLSMAIVLTLMTLGAAWALVHFMAPQGAPREAWIAAVYKQMGDVSLVRGRVLPVAVGLVFVAAAEELIWRGVVTYWLEELVGSRRAWIASAFCYALAHAPTAWVLRDPVVGPNPMIVLGALGAGLLWGATARMSGGRLVPVIVAHAAFDWCVVVMFRLWGASI